MQYFAKMPWLHNERISDLRIKDVEMLPMEKIRLIWHGTDPIEEAGFRLQNKWTSNTHLPNVRTFQFICL